MNRSLIGITAIVLTLMMSVVASGQTNRAKVKNHTSQRGGKALVKKLPTGLQGVQLSGNKVRVKPGYKFVKQADGSVTVSRIKSGSGGGTGLDGKWSCNCGGPLTTGSCDTITASNSLSCTKGTCTGTCTLTITTTKGAVGVVMY